MATIGERLRNARIAAGYDTAAAAARAFGWHKQNVADQEADRRGVSPEQAKAYARAYHIDPTWLLFGGANRKPRRDDMVPIIGKVGADPEGRVLLSTGQASGDTAPLPPGGSPRAVALEVTGHSMHGLADDGSLIYFEDQHTAPSPDHIGRVVVVELDTGEVLIKRLLRGEDKGAWDLESIVGPPRRNVRLRWVASITALVPPPMAQRIINRGSYAV